MTSSMSRHAHFLRLSILASYVLALPTISEGQLRGFVDQTVIFGNTTSAYQMYLPSRWAESDSWPVILFLHGSGERGSDGEQPTEVGLGQVIREDPGRVPAIVTFPQCRDGAQWSDPDMIQLAMMTIDRAIYRFKGDPRRVYLTGLSMGGHGTWHLATKYPERFAALAPIAARAPYTFHSTNISNVISPYSSFPNSLVDVAEKIAKIPTWVFHGRVDPVIPVLESRKMIATLRKTGSHPRYTEYEHIGHASWEAAYAEPDFFLWLFSQQSPGNYSESK